MRTSRVAIALLVLSLAYVSYRWVDVSISYGYASAGEDDALAESKRFRRLLLSAMKGQDKARVMALLHDDAKAHPEEHIFIKDEGRSVSYDNQDFRFSEGGILEGIGQGVGVPSPRACGGPEAPTDAPCAAP